MACIKVERRGECRVGSWEGGGGQRGVIMEMKVSEMCRIGLETVE